MSDRWHQIDALFEQALDRPAAERAAFLDAACAGDDALRAEVEQLLASAEAGARWLGESVEDFAGPLWGELATALGREGATPGALRAEDTVGPYRLVRELGRGGMGAVWLADDERLGRQVALKVVKRGMDTDAVLARFRSEQRILASLEHPRIARLYDAGALPDGRPYLAMAYAEGQPVTAHADAQRLGVDARLRLLLDVADAVAYAHQRLVVHRDLKPSNVLATEGEGGEAGRVTLLDFGIAKLLAPDDGDGGVQTRQGERPHTPAYAAPEQLDDRPVTTATDVYALGVVAYELLTGHRPPPASDGTPPVKPSVVVGRIETRAGGLGAATQITPEAVAEARGTAPDRLARRLRGDLDTILLKALAADPARRYPTADAFAADLRRHRDGLPVAARPDGVGYRLGKFVRRHRAGVALSAVALLALVAFAVVVALQQRATERERDRATAALADAEEVAGFLEGLFTAADPYGATSERPDTLRAADLLDRGAAQLRTTLADQPLLRARMLTTLGATQRALSRYAEADTLLTEARALREAHRPPGHPDRIASLRELGLLRHAQGAYTDAETLFREALAHPGDAGARAATHLHLAATLRALARHDAADSLLAEVVAQRRAGLDAAPASEQAALDLARALVEAGRAHLDRGRPADAEAAFREAVALHRRALPPEHPALAQSLATLADALRVQRRLDEAAPLAEEALAIRQAALGEEHVETASARYLLASLLREQGQYDEALTAFGVLLDYDRRRLGPDHPYVGLVLNQIAITRSRQGAYEEARARYQEAREVFLRTLAPDHDYVVETLIGEGVSLLRTGAPARAEPLFRQALAVQRETLGADSWRTGMTASVLGECLWRQGRTAEAEAYLVGGYETVRDAQGPQVPTLRRLVAFYENLGRTDEAARYQTLLDA